MPSPATWKVSAMLSALGSLLILSGCGSTAPRYVQTPCPERPRLAVRVDPGPDFRSEAQRIFSASRPGQTKSEPD